MSDLRDRTISAAMEAFASTRATDAELQALHAAINAEIVAARLEERQDAMRAAEHAKSLRERVEELEGVLRGNARQLCEDMLEVGCGRWADRVANELSEINAALEPRDE